MVLILMAAGGLVAICVLALISIDEEEPRPGFHTGGSKFSIYDAWDYVDGI
jgi:hypothetical protein